MEKTEKKFEATEKQFLVLEAIDNLYCCDRVGQPHATRDEAFDAARKAVAEGDYNDLHIAEVIAYIAVDPKPLTVTEIK